MNFISTVKTSLDAMRRNKTRAGLTVLGMVIGIASVVIVFSAGEGINGLILGQIESFGGSDMLETEIKVPSSKKGGGSEIQAGTNLAMGVQITTLTLDDMEDINNLSNIDSGYAAIMSQDQANYGDELRKVFLYGVSSNFIKLDKSEIEIGRFFTEEEDKSLSQVVILGKKIKDKLFGESDPLNKFIKIHKNKYKVIGVLEERGAIMSIDFDDFIYMPIRTLQKKNMGINHVSFMMHKVLNKDLMDETKDQMSYILRENHNIPQPEDSVGWLGSPKDDFRVISMEETMEIMGTVTGAITLLLLSIVAISLVVGGVGILNIMYVAVSERTSEIGLRKAVGAKYKDIMYQFLIESIFITTAGGIIGILFGIFISKMISIGANYYGFDWVFSVPIKAYFVSLIFSFVFGILFGLYPARKAARLNPIDALKKE